MKILILLLLMAESFGQTQAQMQNLPKEDVPLLVSTAFSRTHPTIRDVAWRKAGNYYEAIYDTPKKNIFVTYDICGNLLGSELKILNEDLPPPVMVYIKKNYRHPLIKETVKRTNEHKFVTYRTDVNGIKLIFDAEGSFLKSISGF